MRSPFDLIVPITTVLLVAVPAAALAQVAGPVVPAIPMGTAGVGGVRVLAAAASPAAPLPGQSSAAGQAGPTLAPAAGVRVAKSVAHTPHAAGLSELRREIDELKQRARVAEAVGGATQKPARARFTGSSTVYDFRDNAVYQVYGGVERVTDIALQPGEKLTGEPVGGDTVRWTLSKMRTGSGALERWHIILKPMDDGIETNVLIPTDRRVYKLQLRSSLDWFMPGVAWNYPADEAAARSGANAVAVHEERQKEPLGLAPEKLDFNYTIRGDDVEWKPLRVFNDGSKTYLQMPAGMKSGDAPALFVIDESGEPMLVNYRVKEGVYMVDRLFKAAELRVGASQKVVVRHEQPVRTSFWSP